MDPPTLCIKSKLKPIYDIIQIHFRNSQVGSFPGRWTVIIDVGQIHVVCFSYYFKISKLILNNTSYYAIGNVLVCTLDFI